MFKQQEKKVWGGLFKDEKGNVNPGSCKRED